MQPITHSGYFQEGSVTLAWKDGEICTTSNLSTPQRKGKGSVLPSLHIQIDSLRSVKIRKTIVAKRLWLPFDAECLCWLIKVGCHIEGFVGPTR